MYDVPVAVKDALRSGMYKKNYRFVVLNDDGTADFTIDNDNLVSESVSIDERMCSGDTLKFGLCEGSSLEFQYFNKPNITGNRVQAFVDVQCLPNAERVDLYTSINDVGYVYKSEAYPIKSPGLYKIYGTDSHLTAVVINAEYSPEYIEFETLEDGTKVVELDVEDVEEIRSVQVLATKENALAVFELDGGWHTIPLGFFDVKNCSRQASTGIIKASCYNKLMSDYLDAQANESIQQLTGDAYSNNYICATSALGELLKEYSINTSDNYIPIRIGISTGSYLNSYASWLVKLNGQSSTIRIGIGAGYQTIMLLSDGLDGTKLVKVESIEKYLLKLEASINDLKSYIYTNIQNPDTIWNSMYGSEVDNTWSINVYYLSGGMHKYYLDGMTNGVGGNRFIKDLFYLRDVTSISFNMPRILYETQSLDDPGYGLTLWTNPYSFDESDYPVLALLDHSSSDDIILEKDNLPAKVTLRELQSAVYETQCQYGQLSRTTDLFSGVELNHSRLLPADTLYPSDSLYPDGAAESAFRSQYSKLWADEGNVHKWRYLIITYKGLDENNQEAEFTLQRTVNADGTDDYNMSDNWLFKNLVWTEAQIIEYATAMVAKMQDITWFPFEMWAPGLPYLETGDEIEIPLGEHTYTSYILERQLRGIQNLQDTYINGTLDIF